MGVGIAEADIDHDGHAQFFAVALDFDRVAVELHTVVLGDGEI